MDVGGVCNIWVLRLNMQSQVSDPVVVVEEREGQFMSGRLKSPWRTSFMLSNQMCQVEVKMF